MAARRSSAFHSCLKKTARGSRTLVYATRSHLFGERKESHTTTFFGRIMRRETYPLIAAVGGGVLLVRLFSSLSADAKRRDAHAGRLRGLAFATSRRAPTCR